MERRFVVRLSVVVAVLMAGVGGACGGGGESTAPIAVKVPTAQDSFPFLYIANPVIRLVVMNGTANSIIQPWYFLGSKPAPLDSVFPLPPAISWLVTRDAVFPDTVNRPLDIAWGGPDFVPMVYGIRAQGAPMALNDFHYWRSDNIRVFSMFWPDSIRANGHGTANLTYRYGPLSVAFTLRVSDCVVYGPGNAVCQ